jgi:hypothetical protein
MSSPIVIPDQNAEQIRVIRIPVPCPCCLLQSLEEIKDAVCDLEREIDGFRDLSNMKVNSYAGEAFMEEIGARGFLRNYENSLSQIYDEIDKMEESISKCKDNPEGQGS